MRVRLVRHATTLAASMDQAAPSEDSKSLTKSLALARNSLFDEELYHELNREARSLVNQGVRCVENSVRFPYKDGLQVHIHLVSVEETEQSSQDLNDNTVPELTLAALRILLSHAHRQSRWRRSQPPPPITESAPPRSFYALLRPILGFIQHDSISSEIKDHFEHLKSAISAAGLDVSVEDIESSLHRWNTSSKSSHRERPLTDKLVDRLLQPHLTSVTIHLPSKHTTLRLDVRTSILPPTPGTSLRLTTISSLPGSGIAKMPPSLHFPTVEKLNKHLCHVVCLDVISALEADQRVPKWLESRSPFQREMVGRHPGTGSKEQVSFSLDGGLHVEFTHRGETRRQSWLGSNLDDRVRGLVDFLNQEIET